MLNLIYCTDEGKIKGKEERIKVDVWFAISGVMGDTRLEARIVDRERGVGTIMVRCLQGGQTQTLNLPRWWASRYATEKCCLQLSIGCLLTRGVQ